MVLDEGEELEPKAKLENEVAFKSGSHPAVQDIDLSLLGLWRHLVCND